jgi:hypothetical protein
MEVNGENYSVNFDVNVKVGKTPGFLTKVWNALFGTKNYINVDTSNSRSFVQLGYLGTWRAVGRNGLSLADDNPAAHEFGHLLGFFDRYSDTNGVFPGWNGNIMAEPAMRGNVEQRNINALGSFMTQKSKTHGVIRPWSMKF